MSILNRGGRDPFNLRDKIIFKTNQRLKHASNQTEHVFILHLNLKERCPGSGPVKHRIVLDEKMLIKNLKLGYVIWEKAEQVSARF